MQEDLRGLQTPLVAPEGAATQEEKEHLFEVQGIRREGLGVQESQRVNGIADR